MDDKIIALVALRDSTRVDPAALAARMKSSFPWLSTSIGAPTAQPGQSDSCLIPMRDGVAVVAQIHQPIPPDTLEFAIAQNFFWPGAEDAFQGARAHMIVSSLAPTNDPRYMRANAERVTCATAALCELTPAKGVYWATAQNVIEPASFCEQAREAGESGTPFDLWVAVHFFPARDFETTQQIIARTTGLLPFIGREIECGPYAKEPSELGPIVRAVGYYVLDRRVEFQGGEFIGTEENPIGRIDLARTAVGVDNIAVYRILIGGAEIA